MTEKFRLNNYNPINKINRLSHTITGVSVIQAVEALGHNAIIDEKTLRQVHQLGNAQKNGVKSRFTHPGLSSDGLGKFLGRTKNFRIVHDRVLADLHFVGAAAGSPDGDLRTYVEDLATEDPAAFGMSIAFRGKRVWILDDGSEVEAGRGRPDNATNKLPAFRIEKLIATDVVDAPAANRTGIFSAFNGTTNMLAAELFNQIDEIAKHYTLADLVKLFEKFIDTGIIEDDKFILFHSQALAAHSPDEERARIFADAYINYHLAHPLKTALKLSAAPAKLRRSSRPHQYRARLIRAGRPRDKLNKEMKLEISAEAIKAAIASGQFNGLACFIDHSAIDEHPSMRNLLGSWHEPAFNADDESVEATLTVFNTSTNRPIIDLLDEITALQDNGQQPPNVGISLVFYPEYAGNGRQVKRFLQIESADLVFFPAADGRILQKLSALNQSLLEVNKMTEPTQAAEHEEKEKDRAAAFMQTLEDQAEEKRQLTSAWVDEIAQTAVRTIFQQSDLPPVVKNRLMQNRYESPDQVHEAIRAAREELQELDRHDVIQLGDRPVAYVRAPLDDIQSHVDWFFGVPETPAPPANYRDLASLYVALTGDVEFHGTFKPERVMLAAADTTTLANMAVDAMNKVVQIQMSRLDFWRWYERITFPIPNDGSVQAMKLITYGGVGNLPTVAEGAAYTELTVDDVKEEASFTKKGGYVGVTMEMIRNSQIVQIQAVPRALATAAVRTRSAAISNIFTSNSGVGPTLAQDSTALFHANHNNVQTTALGSDLTAWSAARAECFEHTEVNSGKALAVFPRYLLVPAELYDTALSIFGYGEGMPTSYNIAAESRGPVDPRPVPLVVPDWTDANDWAYIVDPDVYPVIQISYAQSPGGGMHPAPELYSVTSEEQGLIFTNDVMPIKVRDWFAVNVNGPRGIGKRNVA